MSLVEQRESIHTWTEVLSHIAQVLALVIAAFWTYKTFLESEQPSLQPKPDVSSDLSWENTPDGKFCDADFVVEFRNDGKQSLEAKNVQFQVWIVPNPEPKGDHPLLLDPEVLKTQGISIGDSRQSGALIGHFPPGVSHRDTFSWRFKRSDADKFAVFQVTVEVQSSDGSFSNYAGNWEPVCGYAKEKPPTKKETPTH